jgi:hypothetical protein
MLDMDRFNNLGVIKNDPSYSEVDLAFFEESITEWKKNKSWSKDQIVQLFFRMIPNFAHKDTGKYLDSKM